MSAVSYISFPRSDIPYAMLFFCLQPPTASSQTKWEKKASQLPAIQNIFFRKFKEHFY